jgi:hypothetical protein
MRDAQLLLLLLRAARSRALAPRSCLPPDQHPHVSGADLLSLAWSREVCDM